MSCVTEADDLKRLVDKYLEYDQFVFDLETMYTPTAEEAERVAFIRGQAPKERSNVDVAWLEYFKLRATDPKVNEVIWIGISTYGNSDSIAVGHPHGTMLKPPRNEKVDVVTAFGEGDPRTLTKGGKLSERLVMRALPPVFAQPPPQLDIVEALDITRPLFFDTDIRTVNQNVGFDVMSLAKYFGGEVPPGPYGELSVALHLLDENAYHKWDLESYVKTILEHSYDKLGSKGVENFGFEEAARYAEQDAIFTWYLWKRAERRLLQDPVLWDLFEFEMDLIIPLKRQEAVGAMIDEERRLGLKDRFEAEIADTRDRIIVDYGAPTSLNLNSTPQKIKLLYEDHGAHIYKRTDSKQPSTDADTLEMIVQDGDTAGEVAQLMIDHAKSSKMYGTYIIGIGARLDGNNVLHPSFSQTAARTGRLSCREPNVQNIPRDSDLREMFIPPPGFKLIDVDYDQVELRFIAFRSKDPVLTAIFNDPDGEDIHTATAKKIMTVLGKDPSTMTVLDRTTYGKTPNFLMAYGGSKWKLAASAGVTPDDGQLIIDAYWETYAEFARWKRKVIARAVRRCERGHGGRVIVPPYTTTVMGRRRHLPNLLIDPRRIPFGQKEAWKEANRKLRAAEREAVNAEIQGSAAEAMKTAIIDLDEYLQRTKFPMYPTMNVHDEIMAIAPDEHAEEGKAIVEQIMGNVVNRRTNKPFLEDYVPLVASGKILDRWTKG